MKIAVAGMKHVCQLQLIFRCDAITCIQYLGQSRPGNNRILNHRIRRDPANSPERAFTRRPKLFALSFVTRLTATAGPVLEADTLYPCGLIVDSRFEPIEFD